MGCSGWGHLVWDESGGHALKSVQNTRVDLPEGTMIILGIILLVVGYLLGIPILWTLGIILVVVGAILALIGMSGRAIGGRRHYY